MTISTLKNTNNTKIKDVKFINDFKNIRFYELCKEEKVSPQNYYKMEISEEKLHNIKINIDRKIKELYEAYNEDSPL